MYRVEIKKSAQKKLMQIPSLNIKKMIAAIDNLAINPRPNGCKNYKEAKLTE
ncbi:MAG: hypothetical protein M3R72_03160 [Bacteroidota bacterium]|nr:hypothetical protein [Bacteroidota bacterium]